MVTTTVADFSNHVRARFQGGFGFANELIKVWKAIKKDFKQTITDQRPALLVKSDMNNSTSTNPSPQKGIKQTPKKDNRRVISADSDTEGSVQETPTKKRTKAQDRAFLSVKSRLHLHAFGKQTIASALLSRKSAPNSTITPLLACPAVSTPKPSIK